MENIKELINETVILPASELLNNRKIENRNFQKPKYPACIFYFGENSFGYYEEMNNDLVRGWGDSANYIEHIFVRDPENVEGSMLNSHKEPLSVASVREKVTEMKSNGVVFENMNHINVYCVLETTSMSAGRFEKWYSAINAIEKIICVSVLSTLIVVLNEALQYIDSVAPLRQRLLEIYKGDEYGEKDCHIYDSVFLIDNQLKNGQYIILNPNSPKYAEYNFFADLVLITNTNDNDSNGRISKLYGKSVPAFSAAYSNVAKPVRDIVMITLKKMMEIIRSAVDSDISEAESLETLIPQILNIKNGNIPVVDAFYQEYICREFPASDCLKYLPMKSMYTRESYEEVNQMTNGCLELFVEKNFIEKIGQIVKRNAETFLCEIKARILEQLDVSRHRAFQNSNENIDIIVNKIFEENIINIDSRNAPVADAIKHLAKKNTLALVKPLVVQAFTEIKNETNVSKNSFGEIYREISLMNVGGEEGLRYNLNNFYENKVDMYFIDKNKTDAAIRRLFWECGTLEETLKSIFLELSEIFNSDPVFRMSFEDELLARIASLGEHIDIGQLITSELINKLDDKLALHSFNVFSERFYEAYFLNVSDSYKDNSLSNFLRQRERNQSIPITYSNTANSEMIESIWFYKCSEDNVRI